MKLSNTDKKNIEKIIKEYFKPFVGKLEKNEHTIKMIKRITNRKSRQLEFIIKIIFNEDLSNIKLSDYELVELGNRMLHLKKELNFPKLHKEGLPVKRTLPRICYVELKSGFKKNSKDLRILNSFYFGETKQPFESTEKIKNSKKLSITQKLIEQNKILEKNNERVIFLELWQRILKKYLEELNNGKQKISFNRNKVLIKKQTEMAEKQMKRAEQKYVENKNNLSFVEEKILGFQNLKKSCTTCYQEVSSSYKKKQISELKKMKKELLLTQKILNNIINSTSFINFANNQKEFRSFKESRKFVQGLKLKSKKEWENYLYSNHNIPSDIPTSPDVVYGPNFDPKGEEEWLGWGDWLGTNSVKKYRTYKETKEFARSLKIKNASHWKKLHENKMLPSDIPKNPEIVYKNQWKGYHDLFSKELDNVVKMRKQKQSEIKNK